MQPLPLGFTLNRTSSPAEQHLRPNKMCVCVRVSVSVCVCGRINPRDLTSGPGSEAGLVGRWIINMLRYSSNHFRGKRPVLKDMISQELMTAAMGESGEGEGREMTWCGFWDANDM